MTRPDPLTVLFVCTGNICRTPMAVGFFEERARRLGLPARAESVGLWRTGEPASPDGVSAMAEHGIDTSGHSSRVMERPHLAAADLVVGMAREHVREAVVLDREVFGRAFTLKELVRRAERVPPRPAEQTFDDWLSILGADRTVRDLLGSDVDDDVADPIGRPLEAYRETAAEIEDLIDRLVARAWPDATARADDQPLREETR